MAHSPCAAQAVGLGSRTSCCPGCAWPDSLKGLHLDICENGIKHVTWEMTRERAGREFIERQSAVSRPDIVRAARVYRDADRSVISWRLGSTQHEHGVDTIREIVNLLLLRGNLGREGAGPSSVRGHSNVQGNRTTKYLRPRRPAA